MRDPDVLRLLNLDNLKNIFARNCSVRRIDKPTAAGFLSANHRLGAAGGRYHYGLFSERRTGKHEDGFASKGELVAVASFAGPRRWDKNGGTVRSYEWVRYASLKDCRVVGGMGKLLSAFAEDRHPDDVMTYSDPFSVDGGSVYRRLGFKSEGFREVRDAFDCNRTLKLEKFRIKYD